jgi:hypothetical protein
MQKGALVATASFFLCGHRLVETSQPETFSLLNELPLARVLCPYPWFLRLDLQRPNLAKRRASAF